MSKSKSEIRLIATVALLIVPIILLGWLFVAQSMKDIAFANKEIEGLRFLRATLPIQKTLISGEKKLAPAQIEEFRAASANYAESLGVKAEAQEFGAIIAKAEFSVEQAFQAVHQLSSLVADKSNLILDPDLPTYYLMDIAVLQIPNANLRVEEMQTQLAQTVQRRINWIGYQKTYTQAIQLSAIYEDISVSFDKFYAYSNDAELNSRVRAIAEPRLKTIKSHSNEIATNASIGKIPESAPEQYRTDFSRAHLAIWEVASTELETLLQTRVTSLETKLFAAAGASAVVTFIALILAIGVLKRLLGRLDDHIVFLAHHDPMTRLKNRASFASEMEVALASSLQTGELLALHVVDCDEFKAINDTYGHQAGDAALQHLADCLLRHTRPHDIVGRLGGDEFVILQRGLSKPNDATMTAERIVKSMRDPLDYKGEKIFSRVSIGSATFPFHANTADNLMQCADASLMAAKEAGRNQAITFSRSLEAELTKQRELEREIKAALIDDRFFLNFQPQFSADGKELTGFEALLRMRDSSNKLIPPNTFVPVAEELGLINEIGAWVLLEAARTAAMWPENLTIAVNLSPMQFKPGNLPETIQRVLHTTGLTPSRLEVEITENIMLEDSEKIHLQLQQIRDLGVAVVMDDFGTGYSSLSYLWRFRFDKIKIERSFMQALESDPGSAESILKSIVTLGHSLEMKVVAEGVETQRQADLIIHLACDEVQGFLYGRPIPEADVASLIIKAFRDSLPDDLNLDDILSQARA
jgi:diguanylate cyclase (GGDEF)-like protein